MPTIKLCKFSELKPKEARGFCLEELDPIRNIFVIRDHEKLVAYENRCPHNRGPLDWMPNQFLDRTEEYIQCSGHGALFLIENGKCIYGPCANQSLDSINVRIDHDWIIAEL